MDLEKTINVLNTLIEINNERIEGYISVLQITNEEDLKTLFSRFARTSNKFKLELAGEIIKLGGEPAEKSKTKGEFFSVSKDVKEALTSKDRKSILSSCEFGEDKAVGIYKKELEEHSVYLTLEQQTMINEQYILIRAENNTVKYMRKALITV